FASTPLFRSVTTYTRSWCMKVYSWMFVGHFNHIMNIDIQFVTDLSKFISQRNINVAVSILHQLRHFCSFSICLYHLTLYESTIDLFARFNTCRCHSTYNAVVVNQFMHDLTWKYPFRAMH